MKLVGKRIMNEEQIKEILKEVGSINGKKSWETRKKKLGKRKAIQAMLELNKKRWNKNN